MLRKSSGREPVNAGGLEKDYRCIRGNQTKKTGSRYSNGNVPNVNWNDDKLNVNWYNPDNANDDLRSREEVSKQKKLRKGGASLQKGEIIVHILSSRLSFWKFPANPTPKLYIFCFQ